VSLLKYVVLEPSSIFSAYLPSILSLVIDKIYPPLSTVRKIENKMKLKIIIIKKKTKINNKNN